MRKEFNILLRVSVAPLAGAWIEINAVRTNLTHNSSLPSRERGLKFALLCKRNFACDCRSPRGSVD